MKHWIREQLFKYHVRRWYRNYRKLEKLRLKALKYSKKV
jgi:hypothetical protein